MNALPQGLPDAPARRARRVDPFPAFKVDEIKGRRVRQVVQRLLTGISVIGGVPNAGKSAVAVHLAAHIADGREVFGRKVRQGPVLYVAPEAPASIIGRIEATQRAHFGGRQLPVYVVQEVPRLGSETDGAYDVERLLETVNDVRARESADVVAIFLDTLAASLGGGDENGAGMIQLVSCARALHERTGATVVIIHHPSKATAEQLRGHTSLTGAADAIVFITNEAGGIRTAKVAKARDFEAGSELHYSLDVVPLPEPDEFGDPTTTVIVRPADAPAPAARTYDGPNQKVALTAFREWARTHDAQGITSTECREMLKAAGLSNKRRPEALQYLVTIGVLTPAVGGYTVIRGMLQ